MENKQISEQKTQRNLWIPIELDAWLEAEYKPRKCRSAADLAFQILRDYHEKQTERLEQPEAVAA